MKNGLVRWWLEAKKHGKQLDGQERFYSGLAGLVTLIIYPTFLQIEFFSGYGILSIGGIKEASAIFGAVFFPAYAAFLFLFWRTFG